MTKEEIIEFFTSIGLICEDTGTYLYFRLPNNVGWWFRVYNSKIHYLYVDNHTPITISRKEFIDKVLESILCYQKKQKSIEPKIKELIINVITIFLLE